MNLAIEIGGTKLQIGLGNHETGELEKVYRFNVDQDKGAVGILKRIEETILEINQEVESIGVGFGGPVNRKTGVVSKSHQIEGWADFNLKKWFFDRYKVPVYIDNDANTAALGEALVGAGKGYDYVFYATLGSGVGGGMVVNGELYHGNTPGEAELGLMTIERDGTSLEHYCSGWALNKMIRNQAPVLPNDSVLKKFLKNQKSHESKILSPAIQQGDSTALEILQLYSDSLAWGLAHVVHLFNPQIIILGGGVSLIGEPLRATVQNALVQHLVKAYQPGPIIRISELKEEVVLVGALSLKN